MPSITKPGNTEIFIAPQTVKGVLPTTWYGVRATGEGFTENMETVKSGEFSKNNGVTDVIKIAEDGNASFNLNLTGDPAEQKVLSWGCNNDWDNDQLLAGDVNKYLAVRRVMHNDEGSFVVDAIDCVPSSLAFSIVAKQLGTLNVVPNARKMIIRPVQLGYQDAIVPNDIFGGNDSVWLDDVTGLLHKRTLKSWDTVTLNASNAFTTGKEWTASETSLATSTGSALFHMNTLGGSVQYDNGFDVTLIFTWMPKAWFSGADAPLSTVGGRDSLYIRTGDGTETYHGDIYQKINQGDGTNVWTKIMNWNTESIGEEWYQSNTITAKSSYAIMKFAELRNVVITDVIGTKCVNDLSFTIDNKVEVLEGECTTNINRVYPDYSAVEVARGEREIKGNFTSYFYNDELQLMRQKGTHFGLEFLLSNGTQGYRIIQPRNVFDGGEPQAPNSTDASVKENFTYLCTIDAVNYNSEFVIEKIDDLDAYPPLYFGWVLDPSSITTSELESMLNYNGNFAVPAKPTGSYYFVVCYPSTEPSITGLIDTDTNLDMFDDYEIDAGNDFIEGAVTYEVLSTLNTTLLSSEDIYIIRR